MLPGKISKAVKHKTVTELWYFIQGVGEVWKKSGNKEEIIKVSASISLSIESEDCFQFRNTSEVVLKFIITTIPKWPGADEVILVERLWSCERTTKTNDMIKNTKPLLA